MAGKRKRGDGIHEAHLTGRESRRRGSWRDNMGWQYQSVNPSTVLENNNLPTPVLPLSDQRAVGNSDVATPNPSEVPTSTSASRAPIDLRSAHDSTVTGNHGDINRGQNEVGSIYHHK